MDKVLHYFPGLSDKQKTQFAALESLYREWNARINVISRKDIDQLYERHVLHSLAIAKVLTFSPGTKILDVGSGGGFPGIPLAILFPEARFHLIDSIGKKVLVIREVTQALQLDNITSQKIRAEELHGSYDFIVSRAVTALPVFVRWVKNLIDRENRNRLPNGILYLKGGDIKKELKVTGLKYTAFPINQFFSEIFFEEKFVVHLYK